MQIQDAPWRRSAKYIRVMNREPEIRMILHADVLLPEDFPAAFGYWALAVERDFQSSSKTDMRIAFTYFP